jgi:hypothetical protein
MKTIKRTFFLLLISFIMVSFSQCSTAQKLQDKAPTKLGQAYCQNWVAGVQGGGSGINIFIPIEDANLVLDSVYFRGNIVKLEVKPQEAGALFIGRIATDFNNLNEPTLNGDTVSKRETTEQTTTTKMPFDLKDDECVVSYLDGTTTKYFKITNVGEKASIPMMSAPPIRNN